MSAITVFRLTVEDRDYSVTCKVTRGYQGHRDPVNGDVQGDPDEVDVVKVEMLPGYRPVDKEWWLTNLSDKDETRLYERATEGL